MIGKFKQIASFKEDAIGLMDLGNGVMNFVELLASMESNEYLNKPC